MDAGSLKGGGASCPPPHIYKYFYISVMSICGKVPIQEAPNVLSCVVSDARVRILG